jgi:hypothetical protein
VMLMAVPALVGTLLSMSIPAEPWWWVRSVAGTPADRLRDLPVHRLLISGTLNQEPMPAFP